MLSLELVGFTGLGLNCINAINSMNPINTINSTNGAVVNNAVLNAGAGVVSHAVGTLS